MHDKLKNSKSRPEMDRARFLSRIGFSIFRKCFAVRGFVIRGLERGGFL
jgi:hypothetical protein